MIGMNLVILIILLILSKNDSGIYALKTNTVTVVAGRQLDRILTVDTEFRRWAESHLATPQDDTRQRG